MNEKVFAEKLTRVLNECDKHIIRIKEASQDLDKIMPLNINSYNSLTKDDIQALDQFLFRFSKLRDAMGRKLFKLIMIFVEGDELLVEQMPFLDILNRLEKIGILKKESWQILRDIRNELAHNYDDDPQEMSEILNRIYYQKETLFQIYNNCKRYLNRMS